jgi:hypothetical protein
MATMEKVLIKSRLDCPPPEARVLLKEKDLLIQKLNEKLRSAESNVHCLISERAYLLKLFGTILNTLEISYDEEQLLLSRDEKRSLYSDDVSPSIEQNNAVRLLDDSFMRYLEKQIELAARFELDLGPVLESQLFFFF